MPDWFIMVGFIIIILAALTATIFHNWRITLIALAVQYLGITIILSLSASIGISIIKLIVGWMSCAVLGITCLSQNHLDANLRKTIFSQQLFRLIAGILIIVVVLSLLPILSQTFLSEVPNTILLSTFILMTLGLLQLGMTTSSFFVIAGLLTFFSGFELLYSILESSSLVVGLLTVINLGLVLVGAFFMINEQEEESV